jgi:hypothetical protein
MIRSALLVVIAVPGVVSKARLFPDGRIRRALALAAYVGPLWHSLLVYLDSCPFLPLFTWAHWFELAPHVVGSWRVGGLPGHYGTEAGRRVAARHPNRCCRRLHAFSAQVGWAWAMVGGVESGVQTLYYALGIIFMLGGAVAAYVKDLQGRIGKQEKELSDYKLYVVEQYVSKEYMNESERRILDLIRDLARRIDNVLHINRD